MAHADVLFLNSIIKEEAGDSFLPKFIVPNEFNNHVYAPLIRNMKGAYFAVGTFRGLNTASLGDFSHIFQMDINYDTNEFNKMNAALIKHSKDRNQYLSYFMKREWKDSDLAFTETDDINKFQTANTPSYIWVKEKKIYSIHSTGEPLPDNYWKNFPEPLKEKFHFYNIEPRQRLPGQKVLSFPINLLQISGEYLSKGKIEHTIFASDEKFDKIKKLADGGKIVSLRGDLAGEITLSELARATQKAEIPFSVIDISNVPSYLDGKGAVSFLNNVKKLPLAEDSLILFTSEHGDKSIQHADHWSYFAIPAKEIDEILRDLSKSQNTNPEVVLMKRASKFFNLNNKNSSIESAQNIPHNGKYTTCDKGYSGLATKSQ